MTEIERLWKENHARTCSGKMKFSDEASASRVFYQYLPGKVSQNPRSPRRRTQLREISTLTVYICTHCSYMHIGHVGAAVKHLQTQENAAITVK